MQLADRLRFFARSFLRGDATLVASIWLVAMLGVWLGVSGRAPLASSRAVYTLPLLLLPAAAVLALIPSPSWSQYFVPLVPFAVLAPVFVSRLLPEVEARRHLPLAIAAICLGSFYGLGNLGIDALRALRAENWVPTEVQRLARDIEAALAGRTGPVATLAPIYVLETSHPVPVEFASAVVVFRTGDLLEPAVLRRLRALSRHARRRASIALRRSVFSWVVEAPYPHADVEAPLRDYAVSRGYRPVELAGSTAATLFIAPGGGHRDQRP